MKRGFLGVMFVLILGLIMGCEGKTGSAGATGPAGPQGTAGTPYTPPPLAAAPTISITYNGSGSAASFTNCVQALDTLGYAYTSSGTVAPTGGPQVIIDCQDGGLALPDWNTYLAGGGDVLVIGGSGGGSGWCASLQQYFVTDGSCTWHQASTCTPDWTSYNASHPILKYMPESYEFGNQQGTYHITHLATGITFTTMLGVNCEPNFIAGVREYPVGGTLTSGTMTILLYDDGVGTFLTANDRSNFLTPFIKGYLEWQRSR